MSENKIVFDSVIIDKDEKTFTVLYGSVGTYPIYEIKNCTILGEKASRKGKDKPFTNYVLLDPGFKNMFEPAFFIGLKVEMNNNDVIAIYVSKEKTYINTDVHLHAMKEAEKIKKALLKYKV